MGIKAEHVVTNEPFIQEYICGICGELLDGAVTADCGHVFCRECICVWLQNNETCPNCRVKWINQMSLKGMLLNILSGVIVRCKHSNCSWQGRYEDKDVHAIACNQQPMDCPNEACVHRCSKSAMLLHSDVCPHRHVSCVHCGLSAQFLTLQAHHEECSAMPTQCPHCSLSVPRAGMDEHLRTACAQLIARCPQPGCTVEVKRNSLSKHMADCHLPDLFEQIRTLTSANKDLTDQVEVLTKKVLVLSHKLPVVDTDAFSWYSARAPAYGRQLRHTRHGNEVWFSLPPYPGTFSFWEMAADACYFVASDTTVLHDVRVTVLDPSLDTPFDQLPTFVFTHTELRSCNRFPIAELARARVDALRNTEGHLLFLILWAAKA